MVRFQFYDRVALGNILGFLSIAAIISVLAAYLLMCTRRGTNRAVGSRIEQ